MVSALGASYSLSEVRLRGREGQHGAMQEPGLCDARRKVHAHRLDNDLADEVSLGLSIPIFRRKTCLENYIDRSTHVHFVYPSVDRHTNVLLLSMEQHGERGGPCGGIGRSQISALRCGSQRNAVRGG